MSDRIRIFDTTLRDGEQTPGVHFHVQDKVDIARRLEAFGVDTIEAGFPASSPGDFEAVVQVARAVTRCEVAALARCTPGDIDAAIRAVSDAAHPVVHMVLGVSDIHLNHKFHITRAEALRRIEASVRQAKAACREVEFSLEDATRAERSFVRQCVGVAVEYGATRINIADTVGCATPWEYGALIRDVVAYTEGSVIVSAHCHNDLGMATANTVAAIANGASQIEGTVNGIGERAGNAAIEEVAVAVHLKKLGKTNIRLEEITALCAHVARVSGVPVQPNRAIAGANAFVHSSGIHQDGVIKDASNYEYVSPATVGAMGHRFVLTARSGRHAIAHVAARLGFELTADETQMVFTAFKRVADAADGEVDESRIRAIIVETLGVAPACS